MGDDSIYPLTPVVEIQHIGNSDGIELTIEDNECEGWYASCPESVHEIPNTKKRAKSLSDEDNSSVPPNKMNKSSTISAGNVENVIGQELSPIANGNSGLSRYNVKTVTQSDIRSGATLIGKTIIISAMSNKKIFDNPIATKNWLSESPLDGYIIGSHQVKGRGKSIHLSIQKDAPIEVGNIKELGGHSVNAWCVMDKNFSVGVISPISPDIDFLNTMLPNLIVSNDSEIIDTKRFKNKNGENLDLIKIVFKGALPRVVSWESQDFRVRPFRFDPVICTLCYKYGHGRSSCSGTFSCPSCSGKHLLSECPKKSDANFVAKCKHCKSIDHQTASRECKFHVEASKIENAKRKGEITYKNAQKQYGWLNNQSLTSLSRQQYISRKNRFEKTSTKGEAPPVISKKTIQPKSGLTIDLNNSYEILSDLDLSEHSDPVIPESDYQNDSDLDTSYTSLMSYAGVVVNGKDKLKSRKPKANQQLMNLDYTNDIAIPKVNNNQISNVTAQHPSKTNVIQENKTLKNVQRVDIQHNILPDNNNQNPVISTNNVHKTNNDCNSANSFGDFKIYLQLLKKCIAFYRLPNKDLEMCVEFFFETLEEFQNLFASESTN